jgi:cytochrome b561
MTAIVNRQHYAPVSIILHWGMLLLIVVVYSCMLLREYFPQGSDIRNGLKTWHFMLGLSVLLLVIVRIVSRLLNSRPAITPEPPAWQMFVAKALHLALYAFMLAMPIAGWLILSASGKTIPFFGLEIFALVGPSKALAGQVKEVHETIATIGYFLIGVHASAALLHHYWFKDNTLLRMLPGKR